MCEHIAALIVLTSGFEGHNIRLVNYYYITYSIYIVTVSSTIMSGMNMDNAQPNMEEFEQWFNHRLEQFAAAERNRITNLENQNTQLQQVINAFQNGHNMGQQQANAHGIKAKAAEPSRYDGSVGSDPTVWLFQFVQYADITNEPVIRRAKLAATYLSGKAATWWMGLVSQQPNGDSNLITWDMFKDGLTAMFQPVNAKKMARDKLAVLTQTHSVVKYNSEFQSLCIQISDISESEKLDRYVRGLKSAIREKVELDEPLTLAHAMSKAQRIDSITYHSRSIQYGEHTGPNTYRSLASDTTAMELGLVRDDQQSHTQSEALNVVRARNTSAGSRNSANNFSRSGNRAFTPLQRLSQEEFKYCQQHRLCLRCKEPGHVARFCSKPTKPLNLQAH